MKTVRILGIGSSLEKAPIDKVETWGLKFTWNKRRVDKIFLIEDLEWLKARRTGRDIIKEFNQTNIPVMCCDKIPEITLSEKYPIEEIKEFFGIEYFVNILSYMIALAIYQKSERIELYGVDMGDKIADVNDPRTRYEEWENERACISFWLGLAKGRGIKIYLPEESTLLKPIPKGETSLYGYWFGPKLLELRKKIKVQGNP